MGENEYSLVLLLRMQPPALLQEDGDSSKTENGCHDNQPDDKTECYITNDEADNAATGCTGCPEDVASLETHEFKGPLKPLEYRVFRIVLSFLFHEEWCLASATSRTGTGIRRKEEQRQCLGSCNEEDTGSDKHHDALLDILFLVVHLDIDTDGSYHGNNTGNGIADFDGIGYIISDTF